jgi:hypothetical protein
MAVKTLTEYITTVSSDFFNLRKTSSLLVVDGFEVVLFNVLEPYLDILKKRAVLVTLTPPDVLKYKFKPQLLSKILYDTENLFYLILYMNNMTVETFIPEEVYLLNKSDRALVENIINKEQSQGTI